MPNQDAVDNAPSPSLPSPIDPSVIDLFGLPDTTSTDTDASGPLPSSAIMETGLDAVQKFLSKTGCLVIADAHLNGLAAPVMYTDNHVYALLDRGVFEDIIDHVLDMNTEIEETSRENMKNALVLAHAMEFQHSMNEHNVNVDDTVQWPEFTGQQTSQPTGVVFSTPHPMNALDRYPPFPERAIAMVGGIQRLALDLPEEFGQRDAGFWYLHAYLTANGVGVTEATNVLCQLYEVEQQCFVSVKNMVQHAADEAGTIPDTVEERYYLSTDAAAHLQRATSS